MLKTSQGSPEQLKIAREFYFQECKKDILFFFNVFLWTYDPRNVGIKCHMPFITWDFQDEYILWMEERFKNKEDGITEKSRDMGVSWMMLGWFLFHFVFDESFQGLLGSRKEDLVDNKEMDSLFGKLDYMIKRLPPWMLPGYDGTKHRTHMKITNPRNGNALLGESANPDFSRQGRYSAEGLDEFAFWESANSVWTATADSSPVRFAVSTPNGSDNKFYDIVKAINKGESKIQKQHLHWSRHPNKNQEWYENEKARRTPIEIAQELDISYDSSVMGRIYDNFSRDRNVIPNLDYNPLLPLYVAWDFGIRDPTAIIWLQKDFELNRVYVIDAYQKAGKEITFFIPFITGAIDSGVYRYTERELELVRRHAHWHKARHFGDPTGNNKTQTTGTSVIKILGDEGIYVNTDYKKFKNRDRYADTYRLIPRLYVSDRCEEFYEAIINSRWNLPEDEHKALPSIPEPIHDHNSHFRTSIEFFAVNEPMKERYLNKEERAKEIEKLPGKYKKSSFWTRKRLSSRPV